MEDGAAGSVSDVDEIGDEYGFTLLDGDGRRIAAFVFATEETAGAWRKLMKKMIDETVAIARGENGRRHVSEL